MSSWVNVSIDIVAYVELEHLAITSCLPGDVFSMMLADEMMISR